MKLTTDLQRILDVAPIMENNPEKASYLYNNLPYQEIIDQLIRDRNTWSEDSLNFFTINGYDVIHSFFEADECERLVALADSFYQNESYHINQSAYFIRRVEIVNPGKTHYDKKTWQIFNVQDIDAQISDFFRSDRIEELFRERTNWPIKLQSCTILVSEAEGRGRQPWHVDGYSPPDFKAFIYLTDVEESKFGPFSVIPGSHKNIMRKWRARCLNQINDLHYAQMEIEFDDSEGVPLVGKKGDCIIAPTSTVHAGWPLHSERTRYVLALYFTIDQQWIGPYNHGRDLVNP